MTKAGVQLDFNWTVQEYNSTLIELYSENGTGNETRCAIWGAAQHSLFQLANLCFAVSFMVPITFQYHVPFMRTGICAGCLFIVIWAGAISCHSDYFGWHLVFLLSNIVHVAYGIYLIYPSSFHPEIENTYNKLFGPLQFSRQNFKHLVTFAQIKDLPSGTTYALENVSKTREKLSILLSGRLKVTCNDILLHTVEHDQIIDSLEYEATLSSTDDTDTYQVTIRAMEDSRLLTWHLPILDEYLRERSFVAAVFSMILAKDITHKLYQVQELLLHNPDYVKFITNRSYSIVHMGHRMSGGTCGHLTNSSNGTCRHLLHDGGGSICSSGSCSCESGTHLGHVSPPARAMSPADINVETVV